MAYNNYSGYYGYPQYNSMSYQQYQQPMAQQQIMSNQQQNNEIPFSEMHFGTIKEAEAYIVAPMKSAVFYNRGLGEIYIKSADAMGNPYLETFKKVGVENNTTKAETSEFDPKMFVKSEDLKNFITKDDLNDFLTTNDFDQIMQEIDRLKKRIQINEIEKKGNANGK